MNCKGYADIVRCIKDTLGESDPCYDCICEVIDDIGEIFGHDWHCWLPITKLIEKLDKNKMKRNSNERWNRIGSWFSKIVVFFAKISKMHVDWVEIFIWYLPNRPDLKIAVVAYT